MSSDGRGSNGGADGGEKQPDHPQAAATPPRQDSPSGTQAQPGIRVLGQYIKDLSFENPGAPESLRAGASPQLTVNVNVNVRTIGDNAFEVELKLDGTAKRDDKTLFIAEINYAGVFSLQNVPQEHAHPMLLIECPRLLFPFARQILADATRQGGFPPMMVDPIDFAQLYRQRMEDPARRSAEADRTASA